MQLTSIILTMLAVGATATFPDASYIQSEIYETVTYILLTIDENSVAIDTAVPEATAFLDAKTRNFETFLSGSVDDIVNLYDNALCLTCYSLTTVETRLGYIKQTVSDITSKIQDVSSEDPGLNGVLISILQSMIDIINEVISFIGTVLLPGISLYGFDGVKAIGAWTIMVAANYSWIDDLTQTISHLSQNEEA